MFPSCSGLRGSLVLEDENDLDPGSGFESELDYRLTVTAEGETLTAGGARAVQVRVKEDGSGYDLEYEGRDLLINPYLEYEARLTYTGTLEGTFESDTLAIGGGTLAFASTPVDCTALADAEREACEEQAQANPGPPGGSATGGADQRARLRYGGLRNGVRGRVRRRGGCRRQRAEDQLRGVRRAVDHIQRVAGTAAPAAKPVGRVARHRSAKKRGRCHEASGGSGPSGSPTELQRSRIAATLPRRAGASQPDRSGASHRPCGPA